MKIGLDARALQTEHRTRGVGRYVLDLIEGLLQVGTKHEYVFFTVEGRPLPDILQPKRQNVRVAPIPGGTLYEARAPWFLAIRALHGRAVVQRLRYELAYRTLSRSFREAVGQHTLDVLHLLAPIDAELCTDGEFGCRRIATFFDAIPLAMADTFVETWPIVQRVHYQRQLDSYRKADAVVAISNASRQDAIALGGLDPERVVVIHCGARPRADVPRDAEAQNVLIKHSIRQPFLVFCSVCDVHKNCEGLLRAFKKVRDSGIGVQLVMVMSRHDAQSRRIQDLLPGLGLGEREVIVTGRIDDVELTALYSRAVALVSPALYEGFGLPALEAMTLGTPVIASAGTSLPEVVGDAGLFFDPRKVEEIAAAMTRIVTDATLQTQLSSRCAARAAMFTIEEQARKMLRLYEGQLGRISGGRYTD